jgi:hypothetical protein
MQNWSQKVDCHLRVDSSRSFWRSHGFISWPGDGDLWQVFLCLLSFFGAVPEYYLIIRYSRFISRFSSLFTNYSTFRLCVVVATDIHRIFIEESLERRVGNCPWGRWSGSTVIQNKRIALNTESNWSLFVICQYRGASSVLKPIQNPAERLLKSHRPHPFIYWIGARETLKSVLVKIGQACFCWYPICVAGLEGGGVLADLYSALRRCVYIYISETCFELKLFGQTHLCRVYFFR